MSYSSVNSGVWVLSLSKSCQNDVPLFSSRKQLILLPFCPDKHFKSSLTFSNGHFEKIHIVKYKNLQYSLYTWTLYSVPTPILQVFWKLWINMEENQPQVAVKLQRADAYWAVTNRWGFRMTIPDINKASMENLCLPTFKSFSSIGDMKFKAITAGPRGERCASVHINKQMWQIYVSYFKRIWQDRNYETINKD